MLRIIILIGVLLPSLAWAVEARATTLEEAEQLLADGDSASAFDRFEQLAIAGDPAAQYRLAQLYSSGLGIGRDLAQAASWFRRAADNGHAEAMFALGVLYANGDGVERDDGLAVDWYVNAAKQGHVDAQYNLGYMYASGRGVDQDLTRARTWYQLAADQGHVRAQINLGAMYASGDGVPRDDARAAQWYRMAARQGDPDAQYSLGYLYEFGRGVSNDQAEALRWYAAAAEQGHIEAGHRQDAVLASLEASARRVEVETANLRAGPGTSHGIIGKLPNGTAVIALDSEGDWLDVSIPGNTPSRGWLHGSLLGPGPATATAESPSPPPAATPSSNEAAAPAGSASSQAAEPVAAGAAAEPQAPPPAPEATQEQAARGTPGQQRADLTAQARTAQGELKETLDERDALLERLAAITKQTAALTAQIETMEAQRAALLAGKTPPGAAVASQPAPVREPASDAETTTDTPVIAAPTASPGSDWLREGFAAMLERLDTRLRGIEARLVSLETHQTRLAREMEAAGETRAMVLDLAQDVEKKLVAQRLQAVEAQASEMGARLEAKQLHKDLAESQQRARDLERQLATRAADRDEQAQRMISLEEERDALMTGLDAAERRLAHLRDQLESDDPPKIQAAPLQAEPATR